MLCKYITSNVDGFIEWRVNLKGFTAGNANMKANVKLQIMCK
jgi:hypothetical protein